MFYCSASWQFLCIDDYNAEHFFAFLPTAQKIIPHCCLQQRKFFRVVGNNAEKCSNLMCFSTLLPKTQIIFPRCGPQHRKIICVVAHNVEKRSALFTTTHKNVEFNHLNKFKSICEFTLGFQSGAQADVFHEDKLW